jgi:hypothetical protein
MNITKVKYCIPVGESEPTYIFAIIDGVTHTVPMNTSNRHYAEILKQVADGDITIAEAD